MSLQKNAFALKIEGLGELNRRSLFLFYILGNLGLILGKDML